MVAHQSVIIALSSNGRMFGSEPNGGGSTPPEAIRDVVWASGLTRGIC